MKNIEFRKADNSLKSFLKKGIEKKVFSGVAIALYQKTEKEEKRLIYTDGLTRNDKQGVLINRTTLFDLASLTKPLCTVLCILCLIENKKIEWQSCLGELVPCQIPEEYKDISIEQLLSHAAGLQAYKPFYKEFYPEYGKDCSEKLLLKVLGEKPASPPWLTCLYSDLGYIILGKIIEYVSGISLDSYFREEITVPLGLEKKLFFRRPGIPNQVENRYVAATEDCPWRGKIQQGDVHDEHCWLMNGVAGHAGLFGTAGGVLSLTEAILQIWQGRKVFKGFSRGLLQKTLTKKYPDQTWCLGFDTPSLTGSSAGQYFSTKSVGHLGYTGTSFWIDPEKDIIVVLLTNRVYPSRKNEQIREFRPAFHDTVMRRLLGK